MISTASLNLPRGKCVGGRHDASLEQWFGGRELDALGYRIRPLCEARSRGSFLWQASTRATDKPECLDSD